MLLGNLIMEHRAGGAREIYEEEQKCKQDFGGET
jgi:hypothetical protein